MAGRPADRSGLNDTGGEGGPTLSAASTSVRHGDDEATGCRSTEGKLRRTPTSRTKCRIWVLAKPLRFEHWGAREDFPLPNHALSLTAISKLSSTNPQHKRHEIYTGSGHRCGVIPYSSVVWWIASWAEDELNEFEMICLLLWWLVLFIEALVPSPNIEQEGSQQRPI